VLLLVSFLCLALAALPALMFLANRRHYRPLPLLSRDEPAPPPVSVLIPARNEESGITATLTAVLQSRGIDFEVLVGDDHSTDRTAERVRQLASQELRLSLLAIPDLPPGWCGKQHACWVLSQAARHELLLFLDADVRLEPDALARMARHQASTSADLVSGFPRQETGSFLERLLIPLIHFLLLGYLPMGRMRRFPKSPAYAAGCGQLFLTRRASYLQAGGHAAIRASLHDGIKLPRAYRAAGLTTDLFDATDLATCRMYRRSADVWFGLAKNATEGLASSLLSLMVWSMLLGLGHVAPPILLVTVLVTSGWAGSAEAGVLASAMILSFVPRLLGLRWFRQSKLGAVLHPVGVAVLLALQWFGYFRHRLGYGPGWKGRVYPLETACLATEGKK
jgi:hypothetical protein